MSFTEMINHKLRGWWSLALSWCKKERITVSKSA